MAVPKGLAPLAFCVAVLHGVGVAGMRRASLPQGGLATLALAVMLPGPAVAMPSHHVSLLQGGVSMHPGRAATEDLQGHVSLGPEGLFAWAATRRQVAGLNATSDAASIVHQVSHQAPSAPGPRGVAAVHRSPQGVEALHAELALRYRQATAVDAVNIFGKTEIEILDKGSFWLLMAILILAVGAAVVAVEVNCHSGHEASVEPKGEALPEEASALQRQAKASEVRFPPPRTDALMPPPSPAPPVASPARDLAPQPPPARSSEKLQSVEPARDARGAADGGALKRLLLLAYCVAALNVSMLLWGIAQEFVVTTSYSGETVPGVLFVVFCNRVVSALFTGSIILVQGRNLFYSSFFSSGPPACSNGIAAWCQYACLDYIPFTFLTLAKSAKLLPVLVISSARGKRHSILEYAEVLVIVSALAVFSLETEQTSGNDETTSTSLYGFILVGACLFFDSLTPHLQDVVFTSCNKVDAIHATFQMSVLAASGALLILLVTNQLMPWIVFLQANPEALLHLGVLSCASCLTQYFISFTIKHFGPTVFTLIVTTRQVISVVISAILFAHSMSFLAWLMVGTVAGAVIIRSLRRMTVPETVRSVPGTVRQAAGQIAEFGLSAYGPFVVCAFAIHVSYLTYAIVDEHLSSHYFGAGADEDGEMFIFPIFSIVCNHCCGVLLAMVALRLQGLPFFGPNLKMVLLPASSVFTSTVFQHQVLYLILLPTQTLMKTLKVIPVMLVGRLINNRHYSALDYVEGVLIMCLVGSFVWNFQIVEGESFQGQGALGIAFVLGYVMIDSFKCNLEDFAYQTSKMDAAQMLLGLELLAVACGMCCLAVDAQQRLGSVTFLARHPEAITYVVLEALASACGAYACTVTVRLFGPAVFTLVMTSRQIISLVLSVMIHSHAVNYVEICFLGVVALAILTSSLRRVHNQLHEKQNAKSQEVSWRKSEFPPASSPAESMLSSRESSCAQGMKLEEPSSGQARASEHQRGHRFTRADTL